MKESEYHNLGEFQDLVTYSDDGFAEIILENEGMLDNYKMGKLNIRLRGPNRIDKPISFCFLPQLDIIFDKPIYLPIDGNEDPKVIINIETFNGFHFKPETPAELISDSPCCVQTNHTNNSIKGCLFYNSTEELSYKLPITIDLPKIQWRIRGLTQCEDYTDYTDDIYTEDWEASEDLLLHIRMPKDIEGQAEISCNDQRYIRRIRDGKVCFDLQRFSDTVRSNPSPSIFKISIFNSKNSIENINLFKVLDNWKIESVKCSEKFEGLTRSLHIIWSEVGGNDQERTVRLWNLINREEPVITETIQLGSCELIIQDPPSGKCRLQVTADDPWNSIPVFPAEPEPNTSDIIINPRFQCECCSFSTFNQHEIVAHIKENHVEDFYRHLTYEEIRREERPDLPEEIYKCPYCDFYCESSDLNRTTKIIHHVENCSKAKRDKYGKVLVGLHKVTDLDEIRQHVNADLPYSCRCKICDYIFVQSDIELFRKHLIEKHKDKLYSVR
ncbi:hypothetical protein GF312_09625 [Candidatus Poribacteria bacterium]|nr:hypothetical protein [Candidatus Poribacteria bacterium]